MDLAREVDGYCERLGPEYWAEPVNAITNAAFLVVAVIMWRRAPGVPLARGLSAVLFAIGVGSFLFHTHATVWAGITDVVPILLFILLYIFAINRDVLGLRLWWAVGATALFLPFAALTVPLFRFVPLLGVSAGYLPVPSLILMYAVFLANRAPEIARGFVIGAMILLLSLTFRSLDLRVCDDISSGTHFLWHILNACMLGWMIEVYRRRVESGAAPVLSF